MRTMNLLAAIFCLGVSTKLFFTYSLSISVAICGILGIINLIIFISALIQKKNNKQFEEDYRL